VSEQADTEVTVLADRVSVNADMRRSTPAN